MTVYFFFFNDTATTEIYTLSLHDALPISPRRRSPGRPRRGQAGRRSPTPRRTSWRPLGRTVRRCGRRSRRRPRRSEEHTSELQSRQYLVCRLLLEKKKNTSNFQHSSESTL